MREAKGKIISAIIGCIYSILAYFTGGGEALFYILAFLILPLACIWFGDELGEWTGTIKLLPARSTPGCLVKFVGWVLLVLPLMMIIILFFDN